MIKDKHNGIISFWKFWFAVLICACHVARLFEEEQQYFLSGSIGVEFFFIVSGYLFALKCMKYDKTETNEIFEDNLKLAWSKIKRFFPYVLILVLTSFYFSRVVSHYRWIDFLFSFYNVLLLPVKNVIISAQYGLLWYISALIIVEFIIFPIFVKNKKKYTLYIAPITSFLLLGYLLIKFKYIANPWGLDVFTYKSVVRAFLDINIGIFVYELSQKFRTIKLTDFSKFILTMIEVFGYMSIFYLSNKIDAHFKYDAIMLLILASCILISFSGKSIFNNVSKNKFFYYLEKLSLPLYINQWFIILVVQYLFIKLGYDLNYFPLLIASVLLLVITGAIEIKVIELYEKHKHKLTKLFIKNTY